MYVVAPLLLALLALLSPSSTRSTPLDDYVWKQDDHYSWTDLNYQINGTSPSGVTWTGHLLNVTSQQWLTPEDVDRSVWWHYLMVIIPSNVNWQRNASMYVTGWSNTDGYPTAADEDIRVASALSVGAGTITGAFFQVPNEHILFTEDPKQQSRTEDAIIAYTWDHFLNKPDEPEWLVRLPMVKSVLRAMDALTEYVSTAHADLGCQLDYYVVAGASKRGWTTWLMGAVDPERVVAIAPIVLDAVNFVEFAHHQFKSYNGWSFALQDYYDMDIMRRFDDPNMLEMQKIEDPYFYFDRLTMPKLICNAVGDEFQQPDDTHYWWDVLPEPKHFMMVPNAEHSMATGILEVVPGIGSWISYLLNEREVPEFKWTIDETNGDITVDLADSIGRVKDVKKFWATTCNGERRDFRFANIDDPCPCGISYEGTCANLKSFWTSEVMEPQEEGSSVFVAHHDVPDDGKWAAFMIQVTYEKPEDYDEMVKARPGFIPISKQGELVFTTEVSIVPDVFPYDDCSGDSCAGTLV
mmetsp:Transcript_25094/g.47164  ORF Transcript_25094/g.47164 Transcript_25094/m.47164 type:complete len:523 (+) Transcript_25094:89-1657(+)|eukprot:CAMPEP_0182502296 /NCGR_PEP_ID=MMETSP1321-20130603/13105_1 /TAXON_ID=91990 /ORGANISM="Bolidomonas sp., Strain RCC1657" /LENGTH=522 /DNA_ID=CAMNT_0024707155 /DNA_START=52 /DNA_END=1620 /DNA_ORIENTATION=-